LDGGNEKMARVNVSKDYKWGLKQEESTMKVVSKELGTYGEFKKMGKYKNFDYCAWSENKCCFVEIKSRRINYKDYEETIVPAIKIKKALKLIGMGHKAFLALNFQDGIYILDLCNAHMHFGYNARTDRGALELNHYAFIPLEQFKQLSHND